MRNADILVAEKALAKSVRYENHVAGDAAKVTRACYFTDVAARKVRRLIEQGATVSPRTQNILAYLDRAS